MTFFYGKINLIRGLWSIDLVRCLNAGGQA